MNQVIYNGFDLLSNWIARTTGKPQAFLIACAVVIFWAVTGPLFGFSDTWQLVINTSTTIVTFLMVFLLQNTGNRTIEEMHDRLRCLERQNSQIIAALNQITVDRTATNV
jgi:low affinity Fe/Cu permease